MTADGVTWAVILSLVSVVCTVINTIATRRAALQDTAKESAVELTKINVTLTTVSGRIDDILRTADKTAEELKTINERMTDHEIRLRALEEKIK